MNDDIVRRSPSGWSSISNRFPNQSHTGSPIGTPLYRSSSNMSIKSSTTINSLYNVTSSVFSLKPYSSVLPYRVVEVLSTPNLTLKTLTARISKSGWAWIVCSRRLFVWRYLDDAPSNVARPKASKCYELLLPPSDIAHKADLICVLSSFDKRDKFPSALAVSPEGAIRYWPNVFQESNMIDSIVTADLQGQECLTLVDIQPLGCVLGTTTNSLVHISMGGVPSEPGQTPILCRTLNPPQGILSGIGRKVSSFIFGSLPTTHLESKHLVRIVRNNILDDNDPIVPLHILVLSNCSIQKWTIEDYQIENFVGEVDLERHIKEAFISKLWNRATTHHNQLTIWPIDVAFKQSNDIILFVACNNSDNPNENYFGFFTLSGDVFDSHIEGSLTSQWQSGVQSSSMFKSFKLVRDISLADTDSGSFASAHHKAFSIVSGNADDEQACYICSASKMYRINLQAEDNDEDVAYRIDFELANDYLLGAVVPRDSPLLFTFKNGFVSIHSMLPQSASTKQLSSIDREFVNINNADKFTVLKRALTLYLKGEKTRGELIVQELFPFIATDQRAINTGELDEVVCAVSKDICDQIPHADPRWANFSSSENGNNQANADHRDDSISVNYVVVTNQLEDKLVSHQMFIELLERSGAWEALTSLTTSGSILPSKLVLAEHDEKLIACLSLRKLHMKFGQIIEAAINQALEKRQPDCKRLLEGRHLTCQDLFYREVTKIDQLFWQFAEFQESQLSMDRSSALENIKLVHAITDIITTVFAEVCLYRQNNGALYQSAVLADSDYVPWSSTEHVSGVRETWLKQFDLLIKYGGIDQPNLYSQDEANYSLISQKIVDLADIILDSYIVQLSYLSTSNEKYSTLKAAFQANRHKCLMPLLHLKQYERAASLAEKYEDFDILIKICEELNNQDQLQQYVNQFASKGFSEYLFEWYLKEGKQGKMLSTVSNNYKLTDFLSNHESLNWLHQIHLHDFQEASSTLKKLAAIEDTNPARKKTLLSIGKLALIASGNARYSDFDDQIKFINYQEALSESLLKKHNLNKTSLKVLSPETLVDLLTTGVEGPNEDLTNFHKALEISEIIEKRYSLELYRQASVKIWRKAFLKDDWQKYNTDKYEVPIKQSFFYQLATTYFGDEPKKLPPLELFTDNFGEVNSNEKISFFLRATYELILH